MALGLRDGIAFLCVAAPPTPSADRAGRIFRDYMQYTKDTQLS